MKLQNMFLLSCIFMTASVFCSEQVPNEEFEEVAQANTHSTSGLFSWLSSSDDALPEAQPYNEALYSLVTFMLKTNTQFLFDREEDKSLKPTLEQDPTRPQTVFARAIKERMGKPDLLSTNKKGEWNQDQLKRLIEIGKKYSQELQTAQQSPSKAKTDKTSTIRHKLELDSSVAATYREQQEKLLVSYLLQEKIRIYKERATLEEKARNTEAEQKAAALELEQSKLKAIAEEKALYTQKWEREITAANEMRARQLTEYAEEKIKEELAVHQTFQTEVIHLLPQAKTIASNLSYFRKRSDYKKPSPYHVEQKVHYNDAESFSRLLDTLPDKLENTK